MLTVQKDMLKRFRSMHFLKRYVGIFKGKNTVENVLTEDTKITNLIKPNVDILNAYIVNQL